MTEQASLLLACTNQQQPASPVRSVGDPLRATPDSVDLEANNNTPQPAPFVDIVVGGMTCTMCSQAITRAMQNTEGVSGVNVSLSTDIAHVEFDPSRNYEEIVEQVEETISDIGYMVVDVESITSHSVHEKLKDMDHTIRTRVLYKGDGYVGPKV